MLQVRLVLLRAIVKFEVFSIMKFQFRTHEALWKVLQFIVLQIIITKKNTIPNTRNFGLSASYFLSSLRIYIMKMS